MQRWIDAPMRLESFSGVQKLYHAAAEGREAELRSLLDANVDINECNGQETALLIASSRPDCLAVQLLLHFRASVDMPNSRGMTPLIAAISKGHELNIALLLNAKANANAKFGLTADTRFCTRPNLNPKT